MFNKIPTLKEILEGIKEKKFSESEVLKYYLSRIKKYDTKINSFITKVPASKIKKGIPIAYKDIYSTKDLETTAASNILKGYIPPYNATSVERLSRAGFSCIGKLNCDAFAHGTTGENSDFGPVRNPYDLTRTPGGSSSGSAAAVASGFVPIATGTDTGGSIRLPASFTNTVGIKPTYGLVSRYGIIAMTSSTDSIGHFTRTVWDNAYVLNITAGHDPKDATSARQTHPDYLSDIEKGIKGLKIGYPKEFLVGLDPGIKEIFFNNLKVLENLGAHIQEVSLPNTEYGISAYYIITPSEISSNLARFDGIRFGHSRETFGAEAKRRILMGTFSLSAGYYDAYYLKAQKVRTLIIQDFKNIFSHFDGMAAPSYPSVPPKLGENMNDPIKAYLMDVLTVTINLAGVPSLAVPAGFDAATKLPIGIQFIGDHFNENALYKVGYAFEQETKCYDKEPRFVENI